MKKPRNGISYLEAAKKGGAVSARKKRERVNKYNLDPTLCRHCSESLLYEKRKNKFCGHSCAASFSNLGVIRNIVSGKWRKKPCLNCEKITENVKFCNISCYSDYTKQQRREKIRKAGRIFDKKDKWYLIETRSHSCEKCNTSIWNGEDIPLDIHHEDGNDDNNKLDNLLLICPNCHRQTNNHGSKNKTNSKRKIYRKKRYDKGLSY